MSTVGSDLPSALSTEEPSGAAPAAARRGPRISRPEVFDAADALLIEGHRPTIDRVRMRLGRGSPNTINEHLDVWWAKLGARLRDLPGREFPQLPERVAHTLQALWTEALESAHAALKDTLTEREGALARRHEALEERERAFSEREQVMAARSAALEESLALARAQLTVANQRAERLEGALEQREAELARLRAQAADLERTSAAWQTKLQAAQEAHQDERGRLESRYAASEARWLSEVDRARQRVKEAAKEHDRQVTALRNQADQRQRECEHLKQQLAETRAELKATHAVREHLEARLHQLQEAPSRKASRARPGKPVRRAAKAARVR